MLEIDVLGILAEGFGVQMIDAILLNISLKLLYIYFFIFSHDKLNVILHISNVIVFTKEEKINCLVSLFAKKMLTQFICQ